MAAVILRDVSKRFGAVRVIEHLDLEVRDGELLVLVGPSGCGKSTALRMVAGLEDVTSGEISIGGRVVNDVPPKDRDIAMVFQSYALYPHLTVRENLAFGLELRKTPPAETDRRIREAAQLLGLEALLHRKPKELSGGQRQRVALGRAIVRKPAVFLFDEPLSNLDAKLRVQMRAELKKLQARLGVTAIYVTHDQTEAMTMGHRIAVLDQGKLQQLGTPLEVYERPANLFVAAFVGTPPMSFLRATVRDGALSTAGARIPVPARLRAVLADGRKVVVGVRPEHVVAADRAPRGEALPLELTVDLAEPLGDEVVVHGHLGGEVDADAVVWRQDPHLPVAIGANVPVKLELDALHVFDAETELRVDG
jgi:multiple sugar transport system ATP-binding protein